ncbi:isoleucine--tRNA ligase [Nanoarchaeota archaeon]
MYDIKDVEGEILLFWRKINLLELLRKKNKDGEKYFILDGPPYANDVPHVGHIRNTVWKDIVLRLRFMQGKKVIFQAGFDTHGLPIENKVEKLFDLKSKKDINKMGVDKFTATCKEHAATNKDLWLDIYEKLGSWYSWEKPYLTYENNFLESGWWTFSELIKKDLIYEGKKPVFWCPKCETALSGYEVTDSYAMVSDPYILILFKLKDRDEHLLVFTTTPWTLISNTAIAVHPEKEYVTVETIKGNIILAKNRLPLLTEIEMGFKILKEFKGKELEGKEYEPLIDVPNQKAIGKHENAHKIIMSIQILKERAPGKIAAKKEGAATEDLFEDFVTVDEGTGLVHTAPGHGKTDNEVGKHYGLPEYSPLDDEAKFTEDAGPFKGIFVKEADKAILELLEKENKLLYSKKVEHKYPLCWRCKAPLIFRMSNQWFCKVPRDRMLELNEKVKWMPKYANDRFKNWVANAEDWNISRQRFWGIPIPVWRCECGEQKIINSLESLKKNAIEKIEDDFDLHTASKIHIKCECGKEMSRINDIFDVWFDSGIAGWASMHYPFENKEKFESHFPINRINESQDQIRGWFYALMFCATATFDKRCYDAVSMTGWVTDKNGDKMSKSVGNVVFAKDAIKDMGADVLRLYYLNDIAPYQLEKFNVDIAKKDITRIINILWNMHNLLVQSKVKIKEVKESALSEIEDIWIMSRLNTITHDFSEGLEEFEFHEAGRKISDFIMNDVSRKYIQMVRERMEDDKEPYHILNTIILRVIKLLAPVTPIISEKIYQNLKEINDDLKESVHLEEYPIAKKSNTELEDAMSVAQEIIQSILNGREKLQLGVRWPIGEVVIFSTETLIKKSLKNMLEIIKTQTNVKDIKIVDKFDKFKRVFKLDYGKVGPEFQDKSAQIIAAFATKAVDTVKNAIENKGEYEIEVGKEKYTLKPEHFIIEKNVEEPYFLVEFRNGEIFLNKERTDALEAEGYAREVIRRIQMFRKESGLNKQQSISLYVKTDEDLDKMLQGWEKQIAKKVGAKQIRISNLDAAKKHENVKQDKVKSHEFDIMFDVVE